MRASQNLKDDWKNVPTRTITAGGVEFGYRELGTHNPGTPVVFLIHLAAVLDNWDPRARRQLLLPINDNYFCRRRVSKGAPLATAAELGNCRRPVAGHV